MSVGCAATRWLLIVSVAMVAAMFSPAAARSRRSHGSHRSQSTPSSSTSHHRSSSNHSSSNNNSSSSSSSNHSGAGSVPAKAGDSVLDSAVSALESGRFAAAEQGFYRAYATEQRPELLFFLGRLAAAQGQGLLARELMRRYLQDPERENHAARQALAQLLIDEPPPAGVLLGELTITGPRGAWLRIDGKPIGVLPLLSSMQVEAGVHSIVIESGSRRLSGEAWVTAGFPTEVRFNLDAKTVFSSAPPPLLTLITPRGSDLDDATLKRLYAALQEAGKSAGLLLMSRSDAQPVAGELKTCLDLLNCQLDLAARTESIGVLRVQVETLGAVDGTGSASRAVQVQFVDAVAGQILSTVRESCEACRASQANERAVQAALRSYREAWARPRGRLSLSTRPEQAEVRVNGRRLARLPTVLAPLAGSVRVEASAPGFRSRSRQVTIVENQTTSVEMALDAGAADTPSIAHTDPADRAPLRARILFWGGVAAVGTGVILSGFGLSGLAVHGQCGSNAMAGTLCPEIYDTQSKGGALLGVGLGLSVAGTIGIVLGREAVQRRKP